MLKLLIVNLLLITTECHKILAVFPFPAKSHQGIFNSFTEALAKHGHEITMVTADPYPEGETPDNITEIDLHELSYGLWKERAQQLAKGKKEAMDEQHRLIFDYLPLVFEKQLNSEAFQVLIKQKHDHFDLLIVEASVRNAILLSHIFKVPVIQISSLGSIPGSLEIVGAPIHPVLYPQINHQRVYNLNIWEKIHNVYKTLAYWSSDYEMSMNEIVKRCLGEDVTMNDLRENVHMQFLNIHPIWEGNRPMPKSVVFIGGVSHKTENELPEDLKLYLDSAVNGVIYVSFGTTVNPALLPPETIQVLVKVLSQQPYDVLWKWNLDELPGRSDNIQISKWLPQSDLLRHPNLKLFITQGGLHSIEESIDAGVPMIVLPMWIDQWYNAERLTHHGLGLKLELESIDEEDFNKAICTVIGNESYRRKVVRLRSLMWDQRLPPLERAVLWTEHVLRNGGARHLRAPAANMPWTDYYDVELLLIVLCSLLSFLTIVIGIVWYVVKLIYKSLFIRITRY